jgi:hypothetical protein
MDHRHHQQDQGGLWFRPAGSISGGSSKSSSSSISQIK